MSTPSHWPLRPPNKAASGTPQRATVPRIGALYAIEAKGKELSIDTRQQLRRKKPCPNFKLSATG